MSAPIEPRDIAVGEHTFHLPESGLGDAEAIVWLQRSGPGATALSNWEWEFGWLLRDFLAAA